jgi:hypothetical protein
MRRIFICVMCVLAAAGLMIAGRSIITQAASTTIVCGVLSSDATWTAANSPYEVCLGGVTVPMGKSLIIEPGVTVQFQSNARLTVSGLLSAAGTPAQPITFTGATPSPGSWSGILGYSGVITPAQVSLDYVTLEYGGISAGSSGAQVAADNADITVTHSLIRNGGGSGIYHEGDAHLTVSDTAFFDNGKDAVRIINAGLGLNLSRLTAAGNGRDGINVASTSYFKGQHHWPAPGLPYYVEAVIGNLSGDSLTIDPGNELIFSSTGYLNIAGEFKAIGLPGAPITLTGLVKTPGSWIGLVVYGGQTPANAQLDYVTIEYGGSGINGANISVTNGYLVARNSKIRSSLDDGVRFNSRGYGTVLNSQIVSNNLYGVRNTHIAQAVLATNNWWGDPSGPDSDLAVCPVGFGQPITGGVLYRPVLTDTNGTAPFPLSESAALTLTPRRWFAPADGITRIYFDITLKDGNGAPLPGRTIHLNSSLGSAYDGGITDGNGHTLAYLISYVVGDAEVTATVDVGTTCEGAMLPTSKVTFTAPIDVTDLFPNSPASYFDSNIDISPLPVTVGVPTTLDVRLTNPLTLPITVDVSFGYAQSGIGLAFGPIQEFVGQVIPANSSMVFTASWLPPLSGHYCLQVTYNITAIGGVAGLRPQAGGSGLQRRNLDSRPGGMSSPNDKDILDKADKSWNTVSKFSPRGVKAQKGLLDVWWEAAKDTAKKISQALGFDPPRQDYAEFTQPVWHTWPATPPGGSISPARAAAINAVSSALADVNAYGSAAALALDRYAGASEANNLIWASEQANARLFYEQQMGGALLVYADALDAFVQLLIDEGETELIISASEVISYQQDLAANGFTQQEIDAAHLLGMTDADIEAYRQGIIAADPNDLTGNLLDFYTDEAAISRDLGYALLDNYNFRPRSSVGGSPGLLAPTADGNTLAHIDNSVVTLQVGNPLTQTALIDLEIRRIDLPADWTASVSPAQVSLAPGEETTVTVTVLTGSLVPQGAMPRVAVEGYVGDQLLGGVVVEIIVPRYVFFDGNVRLYMPLVEK